MSGVPEPKAPVAAGQCALWLCVAAGVASISLRILYLWQSWRIDLSVPQAFIGAEGLMGIVASDITRGARPVFYYWAYSHGTLEAYLAALAFLVFGKSMTVLRLVPTLLAVSWVPLTGLLAARLYGKRAGYLAATLMALPAQFVFEWGCTAWGGPSRIMWLLLGLYVLLLLLERVTRPRIVALGLVVGISLWVSLLSLGALPIYALGLLAWVRLTRRQWALLLIACVIGMGPLIYGNVREPLVSARGIAAQIVRRAPMKLPDTKGEDRFYRSVPLFQVLGAQPRSDGRWSASGSVGAAFLVVGTAAAAWQSFRRRRTRPIMFRGATLLLACVASGLMSGLPGFFGEPVARYSIGLYPAACVLAVGWLIQAWPRLAVAVVALFAVANTVQLVEPIRAQARTPAHVIIDALLERGLNRGFGAGNMYDLVFESGERLIIEPVEWTYVPRYQRMMQAADRTFYIYREDQKRNVSYQVFMAYLANHGIRYQHFDVAEYHVLYDFEPPGSVNTQAIREMRKEIRQRKGRLRQHAFDR